MYLPGAVLGLLRPKPLLLRLDAPTLRLPQVDVYLLFAADPDPALLEVLPEAVRRLPLHVVFEGLQLVRRQFAPHAAFSHTPEPPVPHLGGVK